MPISTAEFSKRAAIFIALALTPVLLWLLFDVVLLVTGAILVAVLVHVVAKPFRWIRLPGTLALFCSGALILAVLAGALYLFGSAVAMDLQEVLRRAEEGEQQLTEALQGSELGRLAFSHAKQGNLSVTDFLGGVFRVSANLIAAFIVAIVIGVFLAAQPSLYREGLTQLFPRQWRDNVDETLGYLAAALRLWLIGQLIEMWIVGLMVGVAVALVGLPSPLGLAAIAGLAQFIPYAGAIIGAVPSVLVAATLGLPAVLWTTFALFLIHQFDGNVMMPLIQRRMVFVPPALMLLSIVTISTLFGLRAVIFAGPITVVIYVVVTKLYLRETLGVDVAVPGDAVERQDG
jgi:predicted PurR-regulated permease PerM